LGVSVHRLPGQRPPSAIRRAWASRRRVPCLARTGGPARGGSTETAVPRLPLAESLCSSRWLWRGLRGHALRDDLVVQLADIRVKRRRLDLLRRGDQRLVPEALPVGFGLPDVRDPPAPILARPSERRNPAFRRLRLVWDYTLQR